MSTADTYVRARIDTNTKKLAAEVQTRLQAGNQRTYRATLPRRFLPEAKAEFTERTIHVFFARTGKTL
jgi:hypothetical protein